MEAAGAHAVVVDAFLADLGAARYRMMGIPGTPAGVRVSRPGWRGRRALLLLDDADRPTAQRLLKLVCDARVARPDACDPLLVVAASGGGPLPVPASCAGHSRSATESAAAALNGAERSTPR